MKQLYSVLLAVAFLTIITAGCSQAPSPTSVQSPNGTTSSVASEDASSMSSLQEDQSPKSTIEASISGTETAYNEERFSSMLFRIVPFVHVPISSIEDLKELDLFYFLIAEAEDYAHLLGKTYAVDKDSPEAYRFPIEDLRMLSAMILGFEIDFEPYTSNRYFEENQYLANYYDDKSDEFFIIFAGAFQPASEESVLVSLDNIMGTEIQDSTIKAECELIYSLGMGDPGNNKNGLYQFEIVMENGIAYYRLLSVDI